MLEKLTEGMVEAITEFFKGYFDNLSNILNLAELPPSAAIEGFPSQELWNYSTGIASSIGMGVASTLIALFLFFELASLFNRSDTKGLDGIYWILMAFLKVAVMLSICKHMTLIINIVFEVTSAIVSNMHNSGLFNEQYVMHTDVVEKIEKAYAGQDFWEILGGWISAAIVSLANYICMVLAELVCKLRFIEIYVMVAIAPIPFCTFVSHEYRNIAISYIKRLFALGLQGVFIAIVYQLYVVIATNTIGNIVASGDAKYMMFQMLGYSLLLVIAIFQTGGWSKSLLQVN